MKTQTQTKKPESGVLGRSHLSTSSHKSPNAVSGFSPEINLESPASHPDSFSLANTSIAAKRQNDQQDGTHGVMSKLPIQAKLTIGQPNDKYEQEADRVAQQVVQRINSTETIEREVAANQDSLQKKPSFQSDLNEKGITTTPKVERLIQQERGNGHPLPSPIRKPLEEAFGTDFSQAKIHVNAQSDKLNRMIGARAFTVGKDIFFKQEEYAPHQHNGKALIAHELVHFIQQNRKSNFRLNQGLASSDITLKNSVPSIQRVIEFDNDLEAYYETNEESGIDSSTPLYFTGQFHNENPIFVDAEQINKYIETLDIPARRGVLTTIEKRQSRRFQKQEGIVTHKEENSLVKKARLINFYTEKGQLDTSAIKADSFKFLLEKTVNSVRLDITVSGKGSSGFFDRFPYPTEDACLIIKKGEETKLKEIVASKYNSVKIKELEDEEFGKASLKYNEPLAVKGENYIYLSAGETEDEKLKPRKEKSIYKRGRQRLKSSVEWENFEKSDSEELNLDLPILTAKNNYSSWRKHKGRLNKVSRGKGQEDAMKGWNALAYARYVYENILKVPVKEKMHQDWEWLHIKGAQLGGETISENLIAGTSTTNSRMIPIEEKIRQLSRSASSDYPLSLKFEAECEPKTHLGKSIRISVAAENGLPKAGVPKISESKPVVYDFYPQSGHLFDAFSHLLYSYHSKLEAVHESMEE